VHERVRLCLFCFIIFNEVKVDGVGILTLLRGRLGFAAPFVFAEWWTEARLCTEASEGIMGQSELLVMVEVVFIDTKVGG
jgi:hypothetical protein